MAGQNSKLGMFVCSLTTKRACVDDITMGGKKNNLKSMRDKLIKQVDLEALTPLLHQEYVGCTERECKPNLKIVRGIRRSNL